MKETGFPPSKHLHLFSTTLSNTFVFNTSEYECLPSKNPQDCLFESILFTKQSFYHLKNNIISFTWWNNATTHLHALKLYPLTPGTISLLIHYSISCNWTLDSFSYHQQGLSPLITSNAFYWFQNQRARKGQTSLASLFLWMITRDKKEKVIKKKFDFESFLLFSVSHQKKNVSHFWHQTFTQKKEGFHFFLFFFLFCLSKWLNV